MPTNSRVSFIVVRVSLQGSSGSLWGSRISHKGSRMSRQGFRWLLQSSMNIVYRRVWLKDTRVSIHSSRVDLNGSAVGLQGSRWASKAPVWPSSGSRWALMTPGKHSRLQDVNPGQPWSFYSSRLSLQSSRPRLQGSIVNIQDSRDGPPIIQGEILGSRVTSQSSKITLHCFNSASLASDWA